MVIGIARIFSRDALFFLKKVNNLSLVVAHNHRLKRLNKPPSPSIPAHEKSPTKFDSVK